MFVKLRKNKNFTLLYILYYLFNCVFISSYLFIPLSIFFREIQSYGSYLFKELNAIFI